MAHRGWLISRQGYVYHVLNILFHSFITKLGIQKLPVLICSNKYRRYA